MSAVRWETLRDGSRIAHTEMHATTVRVDIVRTTWGWWWWARSKDGSLNVSASDYTDNAHGAIAQAFAKAKEQAAK